MTNGNTDTFSYDMGGRLLVTYRWSNPTVPELTTYFAGQKLGQYADRVGSVRYQRTGDVTNHYYPYGELVAGASNTGFKFAETYRDDSGLDYALNRYYASGIGRFLSVDPYGGSARPRLPQSWNRYAYVRNDPVNAVDPTGLFIQKRPGWAFRSGSLDCYFDNAEYSCAYMDGGGEVYDSPMVYEDLPTDEGGGPAESPGQGLLDRAYLGAYSALDRPECRAMLNTGKYDFDPQVFFDKLKNGATETDWSSLTTYKLGMELWDPGPGERGARTFVDRHAVLGLPPLEESIVIKINMHFDSDFLLDSALIGNFKTAITGDALRILAMLHEFGHAANARYGSGASAINDTPENMQKLYDSCIKK